MGQTRHLRRASDHKPYHVNEMRGRRVQKQLHNSVVAIQVEDGHPCGPPVPMSNEYRDGILISPMSMRIGRRVQTTVSKLECCRYFECQRLCPQPVRPQYLRVARERQQHLGGYCHVSSRKQKEGKYCPTWIFATLSTRIAFLSYGFCGSLMKRRFSSNVAIPR